MSEAVVLLSGGVDSTTALYLAKTRHTEVMAVSINYGQHHQVELDRAWQMTRAAGVNHRIVDLGWSPHSALTDGTEGSSEVPDQTYDEIKGQSPSYVPFRNGTMLSVAAAVAVEHGCDSLYIGAHAEDAANWAYADCTPAFIGAMSAAILIGTYNQVMLRAPFLESTKEAIITVGMEHGVPYHLTYSCYRGYDLHCGACPTCHARHAAFVQAGYRDPTVYENQPRVT